MSIVNVIGYLMIFSIIAAYFVLIGIESGSSYAIKLAVAVFAGVAWVVAGAHLATL